MKVACVESRGALGGTCLNVGCIPSKALLHSTHLYEHAKKDFAHHGIKVSGVEVDLKVMMANKATAVKGLTGGIEGLFKKNKVTYVKGWGKLSGPNTVSVSLSEGGAKELTAKNILLAVGSEVSPLSSCPVDNAAHKIVDSTGALELPAIPKKMVVVGGGVIGLELGSVWRRLGTEVTVVEYLDTITPGIDKEITQAFLKILKKQGIKFMLNTKVADSKLVGDGVQLTLEPSAGGATTTFDADVVLVSTGRRPFTKNLGLEEMGIETDRMGRIVVNDHFQTKIPSVFAIGDAIDGPMLAHKAEEEGIACVENIAGFAGHVNYDTIPGVIYTYPELATVGQTEEQLIKAGVKFNKGVFPFMANSRARATFDSDGMVKILADKETDRILGMHIVGSNAGEMIAEGVLAMEYGASSEDIARTCHAHPTLSEALKEACMATYDKAIHF
ncbi:dihydrolipoamide dehydrogenase [Ochromonadaceae sp. CCMP2298]|nr:dihydrolipoamide dehydrogenase [Ochromonadaceae sp. CCMP2298]